ncbi:MAG: hypothetical protein JWP89_2180 [Schlesneria sp.]|nr:hypothetical protein [Schlesneria sp.]
MVTATATEAVQTLLIVKEVSINAPIAIAFEAILEEIGPENAIPGSPMPMVLEAWPGGRWYRDLGNNSGHFWGHVQVIKPPTLLEICGPLFMSYASANHLQYRLVAAGATTKLTLTHRAIGMISDQHREGVSQGWGQALEKIRDHAERQSNSKKETK